MSRGRNKQARGVPRSADEARQAAEAWARDLFAPEGVRAVIVEGGESTHNRKTQNRMAAAIRQAMPGVSASVAAGDLDAARAAVRALAERDIDWVHWCDNVAELNPVLEGCVRLGQICYADSLMEGPAGNVLRLVLWRE